MTVNDMRLRKILAEDEDVKRLGISVKYMCLSLMCEHHCSLHGELLDFDRVKEIYGLENVPENCNCGVTQVLMDETGEPRNPKAVERIKSQAKNR